MNTVGNEFVQIDVNYYDGMVTLFKKTAASSKVIKLRIPADLVDPLLAKIKEITDKNKFKKEEDKEENAE